MKMFTGRSVIRLRADAWKRAGETARDLNGWILVALLVMLALGAGFGSEYHGIINLVVRITQ